MDQHRFLAKTELEALQTDDAPYGILQVQCLMEVQGRNGQLEQREDAPLWSAEVRVSLGWLQDELVGRFEEEVLHVRGPDDDIWRQEPPS